MQPDPELERRWRERANELFAEAPVPDRERLDAVLSSVRAGRARAAHRRRLAWGAAAAAMFGMAAASATWWMSREPPASAGHPSAEPATEQREAADGDSDTGTDDGRDKGRGSDGPVIYRRAQ